MRKKKGILILAIIVVLIELLVCAYFVWEKAPDIATNKPETIEASPTETPVQTAAPAMEPTPEPTPTPIPEIAPQSARQDGVYTILLVGEDQISGNTDTILVGKIDTNNHKMDFVSIPRDTLLNMDGDMRKINCIYYKARARGADAAHELVKKVTQIIGFEVDCYAITNLDAFIDTIDAIGGVDYYVNQEIWMDDVWQNLFTCLPVGMQHLDGYHAMCLVRYRAGYADADLGRINVQHDFLKTLAKQMISLGNIPNLPKVIDILTENLDTNLTASNIAFFIRQALMCSPEDINFYTVPVVGKTLGEGISYAVIILYQWRDMLNAYLNPFSEPLTFENLDVMYNDYFGIGCTGEMQGAWYFVGLAEAEMAAAQQNYSW
ncbi:MAG: LCP family protein [Eubacteriales bacterium]|nr:LCP family protein [Eubacteriales bacterium]